VMDKFEGKQDLEAVKCEVSLSCMVYISIFSVSFYIRLSCYFAWLIVGVEVVVSADRLPEGVVMSSVICGVLSSFICPQKQRDIQNRK